MKLVTKSHRAVAGALLATLVLTSFAPAAFAGHGNGKGKNKRGGYSAGYRGDARDNGGRRYKSGNRSGGHSSRQRVHVIERRGSDWGPAVAGFIGGLAVGAIISDRSSRGSDCEPKYQSSNYYEDPYCRERFASLSVYLSHTRGGHCGHGPIARVIDARSGHCERTVAYHDGGWHDYDDSDPDWERGRWAGGGWDDDGYDD